MCDLRTGSITHEHPPTGVDCLQTFFCILLFLGVFCTVQAQNSTENFLTQKIDRAASDSDRILALGLLSDYYYSIKKESAGDSVIEQQIKLAEASRNPNLVIMALFQNSAYNLSDFPFRKKSQRSQEYINRALQYAINAGLNDYAALAYANLANLYCTDGNMDEALKNANLGFTTAFNTGNDSVKVVCTLQLGDVLMHKSEVLMAYKTYTTAFDIAITLKHNSLLPMVYHHMSDFYKKLERTEEAKEYIFRSLEINKENKNDKGLFEDYIALGKLYNYTVAKDYLLLAEKLALKLKSKLMKVRAERILFSYKMLEEPTIETIGYLNTHPDLQEYYLNQGPNYLDWILGEVHLYGGLPSIALVFFKRAEPAMDSVYDLSTRKGFFSEMAEAFEQSGDRLSAIDYYKKTLDLSQQTSDLSGIENYAQKLMDLYHRQMDYKQAFIYSAQYIEYRDSVDLLTKEKELMLLEIDNENKKRQQMEELAHQQELVRHNLQYMAMTFITGTAFILLLLLGMFKISRTTIRVVAFFSFIFFFEFIILLLDSRIHYLTHGEPWKIWVIKIGILSILFPLHHYLEEKLIHYLLSKKLLQLRSRFSIRAFIAKTKQRFFTPQAVPEEEVKEIKEMNEIQLLQESHIM